MAGHADQFVNGAFEDGTFNGWTQGGGFWTSGPYPATADYLPGGANYDPSGQVNSVVNQGFDPLTDIFSYNLNSATAPGVFTRSSSGWYYSNWLTQSIDVSALQGDDFILSLLANDCPYGGHAGYAYLDGFGGIVPPPTGIPEPSTWAMIILGFGGVGLAGWRRARKAALVA